MVVAALVVNAAKTETVTENRELQLLLAGSDVSHSLTINMTGRWDVVPTVHDEQDGEVVIKPTFLVETPHTQTTTPHWMTITNLSTHNWT